MNRAVMLILVLTCGHRAWCQSSSLLYAPSTPASPADPHGPAVQTATPGPSPFAAVAPRDQSRPATLVIERASLIAVPATVPRKFRVNDLITIIVRQQKKYEAEQKVDTQKKWDIVGKLSDWFRFYPGNNLGQDKLSNGQPGFRFKFDNKYKADGETDREDKFTTRMTATVIDVKPNGNLVLEAKAAQRHGEEEFMITLTGTCRTEDVTPDNTILSSQIADLRLIEDNKGTMMDSTRKGWIPKLLDWTRPW